MILKTEILDNGDLVEMFLAQEAGNPNKTSYGVQIFKNGNRNKYPEKTYNFKEKREATFFISRLKANIRKS